MRKPFQFSIGRMLCAVACVYVALWSFSTFVADHLRNMFLQTLVAVLFCASIGCGITAIGGYSKQGVLWWIVCVVAIDAVAVIYVLAVLTPSSHR